MLTCCAAWSQQAADHLFAIIVNGGKNKLMNHERYWNDCAFLFRTLRHDYHLPQRNITLLMSDGGEPGDDQLLIGNNGFGSSLSDLDGDGQRDVFLAATMQNLSSAITDLSSRLTTDDHLFVFLMDHGGSEDEWHDSYLWLWNSEVLSDAVLAMLLGQFNVGSMNIVAGQCYSGGFIDNLAQNGRVITTACRGDELSWACPDKNYDEFVYHWTCAVAGHDDLGVPTAADSDGDGHVSMAEAFSYACDHDRRSETPQYVSQPADLGERWTFAGMLSEGSDGLSAPRLADATPQVYDLLGRPVFFTSSTPLPPLLLYLPNSPTPQLHKIIVKPKR